MVVAGLGGVGLAAGICGGITLQLEPTIAAPDWLVGAIMTMWFQYILRDVDALRRLAGL